MSQEALDTLRRDPWQGCTECSQFLRIGCYFTGGSRKRGEKNWAAEGRFGELREKPLEFGRDHQDSFGLKGAADSGDGLRQMMLQKGAAIAGPGTGFDRAFQQR